jgi:hypothetical protein
VGGRARGSDRREFFLSVGGRRRSVRQRGCEARGELRLERGTRRFDLRPRRLGLALRRGFGPLDQRLGRSRRGQPGAGHANDVGFHHQVVRAADEEQMLHVVPAQEDELALAVEVVDVDDAEARLARPRPVLPGQHEPSAGQSAQDKAEQGDQDQNDDESYDVLGRLGGFDAESGQHG